MAAPTLDDLALYYTLRRERGAITAARILIDYNVRDVLAALVSTRDAAELVELRVGGPAITSTDRPSLHALLAAKTTRWPAKLRRLQLDEDDPRNFKFTGELVVGELPPLDELIVVAQRVKLRVQPQVRKLVLRSPSFDVAQLAITAWPALEALELWSTKPAPKRWLDPARFPKLTSLALVGAAGGDALCGELAKLPIAAQLLHVDLRGGTIKGPGVRALATLPVRSLDVRGNVIGAAARRALAKAHPGARIDLQRAGTRSMLVGTELASIASRAWDARDLMWPKPRVKAARVREALDIAALLGVHWLYQEQALYAQAMRGVTALVELDATWERALMPAQAGARRYLWITIAQRHRELGDKQQARAWRSRALDDARWAGDELCVARIEKELGSI